MKKFLAIIIAFSAVLLSVRSFSSNIKNVIYVYDDEGVSNESLKQTISMFKSIQKDQYFIKTINATQIINGTWSKTAALLVMPGGADLPYSRKLNGRGNEKIKQYIGNGGSYLGICAGAYYGASYVEFDKNGALEVTGTRELQFFQSKAIGPILAPYDYKTESGSRAAGITTIFPKVFETTVYYNGGGFFENAEKFLNTQVIASYHNGLPSIIAISYGKGKVVLSGVHFEYDPYTLDSDNIYIKKILMPLIDANESRKILIEQIFQILGISSLA